MAWVGPMINREQLKLEIDSVPSTALAQVFNRNFSLLIEKIILNIFEFRTLATIRDTLLPKLISGEIRVREAEKSLDAVA